MGGIQPQIEHVVEKTYRSIKKKWEGDRETEGSGLKLSKEYDELLFLKQHAVPV